MISGNLKAPRRTPCQRTSTQPALPFVKWTYTSIILLLVVILIIPCQARRHHLVLQNDIRQFFPISTFGYFPGGTLNITVVKFKYRPIRLNSDLASNQFGFTLAHTLSNNYSPYMEGQRACILNDDVNSYKKPGMITFKFDFKNEKVHLSCNSQMSKLTILSPGNGANRYKRAPPGEAPVKIDSPKDVEPDKAQYEPKASQVNKPEVVASKDAAPAAAVVQSPAESKPKDTVPDVPAAKQNLPAPAVPAAAAAAANMQDPDDAAVFPESSFEQEIPKSNSAKKESPVNPGRASPSDTEQKDGCLNFNYFEMKRSGSEMDPEYSFHFQMFVTEPHLQGLYALYFHNCLNYLDKLEESQGTFSAIDLDLYIEERNLNNFLSAGEIPLPQLFFALSVIFFILGIIWFYSLQNRASETFKIHYLMGVLVFVKAISLLFHGINYYFIARDGTQVETWAILYYITHFLKGALMFITIVLIGTGWAFIKHILSDKDKKIFMFIIPLQVIANVADIITEESEEGALIHTFWRQIFILVDLICCGSILFPVIWSIRHLQEASQTDGKAAINLKKLQLFRHFYVMIVVYIYFTRIIVYLVKITVPFNYEWLDQLFQHVATLIFFILTGYRFQPASSNPYYQLLQEEIEMDEEVLFIQPSTFTEAKKRNRDLESSDVQSLIGRGTVNTYDYD